MTRLRLLAAARPCALAALTFAALAHVLTACSNLPDIPADVCGNGVVEAGEDCDGSATAAGGTCGTTGDNACHYVCAASAACPQGYACGADQRCRAPSATFADLKQPYTFDAIDIGVGDVDGDGTADLLGVSADTLTARFGASGAPLAQSSAQPIRTPVASPVFGDLDGDGTTDVLVPSSVGVSTFLAAGQGLNPYPYTSLTLDDQTDAVRAADVEVIADPFSEVLALIGKNMAYINTQAKYAVCIDGGVPPLCALSTHDVSDLLGDSIPTGRTGWQFGVAVPLAQDATDEFEIAFKGADHVDLWTPTQPVYDGTTADESTLSVVKLQTLALPVSVTQLKVAQDGIAAFGRFDLDACTDLLIPVSRADLSGNRFEGIAIAYGTKGGATGCTGTLDAPVLVAEAELDPDGTTKGLIPRAVADLDGDGISDVVTNEIIAVTSCTRDNGACANGDKDKFELDFRSFTPREWTSAIATDINRDGVIDIAGIVAEQDDVDLMLGAAFGFSNRFQITTTLPPRSIRTGDFDGDLYLDVAIIVGDDTASPEDDHLEVAFGGASGGPSAPVDMGSFGTVQDMEPISLFTDLESIDLISDMLIIADRNDHRGVAPLIGSSTRRLLAPYLLGEGQATDEQHDTPVAVVLGEFDGQAANKDVAALAHLVPQQSPTGTTPTGGVDTSPRVFLLAGQGGGDLLGGQPATPALLSTVFEYRDARWVAGLLDSSQTLWSVIGVDASDDRRSEVQALAPHLFVASPGAGGATWNFATPVALPAPYNAMRVHALHLVDLDADGAPDLVVEMSGATSAAGTASGASFVIWNKGGALDLANLVAIVPKSDCTGSEPIQADTDAALEVATICTDAKGNQSLAVYDWSGSAWTQTTASAPVSGAAARLAVGDFNGDGLDDLAIVSGDGATATVTVYEQCATGDLACTAIAETASAQ